MANNRIGIEVQVEFPTVAELQKQLAQKWKSVKNSFEGKVNVGVDGHSLNRIKKQVQDALDGREFKIKLDNKSAIGEISKIQRELKELDAKINKVREIKIRFDVGDMGKTMKEVIEANQRLEDGTDRVKNKTKGLNSELEKQIGRYDKIARKYKLIDGKKITTQVKTTHVNESGDKVVRTVNSSGIEEERTNDVLGKRQALLNKIHGTMKSIHKKEMEMRDASEGHAKVLDNQIKKEKKILESMKDQYSQKYKNYALQEDSSKELKAQFKLEQEIKDQIELEKKRSQEKKNQILDVQKLVSLEQQIHSLKKKMISANKGEQSGLKEEIKYLEDIQGKIRERLTGENKITSEQEAQISNLKQLNSLEISTLNEKKKQEEIDSRIAREQRDASQKMKADLKEIHLLKTRISQIESRRDHGGQFGDKEQAELRVLQQQLKTTADIALENREVFKNKGLITKETAEQLQHIREIHKAELNRVSATQKVVAENDKVTAEMAKQKSAFQEILKVEQGIVRLQRDLIFAGMREKTIIEDQIAKERKKADIMAEELRLSGKLTAERKKEIEAIRKASNEQNKLNEKRRYAREKDQAYNDTGGLIDPYSTYANGRQAFDAILDPMKEIDESFYSVAKVADATDLALNNFKDSAFDVGSSLGTTASEYMEAVEKWVTAGKTFEESQRLGNISQIGAFVGNISPEEMVKYMSVPLNAYEEAGVEANDIINSMNEVANQNAIEMDDLGKAYVRSATTAKNAGATYSELNGLITAAQEATRKGGERIGTGIKTIGINIQSIQSRFKDIDQVNFDYLEGLGVKLLNEDGSAKTMTESIEELVKVQDKLKPEEFSNAIKAFAGKEHAETLQAIVDEWKTVQKVVDQTEQQMNMGKDGSAYVEFAKQSDSLRFKLAELKNGWDKLMVTIGESDGGMKNVLDVMISGLEGLVNLAENPNVMKMVKAIAGMLAMHAGANGIKRVWDTLATGIKGQIGNAKEISLAWKNVKRDVDKATLAVEKFDLAERGASTNGAPHVVPTVGVGGTGKKSNVPYKDSNGNDLKDRDGNLIYNPHSYNPNQNSNEKTSNKKNTTVYPRVSTPKVDMPDLKKTEGAVKGVTKAIGKTLGLIPLLGDALIILDIMGVPVFEKLGDGFDKLFKGTEEQLKETEKLIEKFKGANELINGTIDGYRNQIEKLEESLAQAGVVKTDKEGNPVRDKDGNLQSGKKQYFEDEEEFAKFKEDFNNQAEGMGLEIRITMNDTSTILKAMQEMNKEKEKLEKKSQIEVVQQVSKDTDKLGDIEEKASKAKLAHDKAMKQMAEAQEALKTLKDENGNIVDQEAYATWNLSLKASKEEIKKTEKKMEDLGVSYEKVKEAIGDNARALLDEGKAFDASKLSKEESISTSKAMLNEYIKLKKNAEAWDTIQEKLSKGRELEASEYEMLIGKYDEYQNKGKNKVETDKEIREEIVKKMEKEKESTKKTLENAEVALNASAKQADSLNKEAGMQGAVKEAVEKTTGSLEVARDKTKEYNKDLDKVPKAKDTLVTVTTKIGDSFRWLVEWWGKLSNKTINVDATGSGAGGGKKNKSVSVGTTRTTRSGRSSASVATGTPVRGVGKAIVSEAKATKDKNKDVNNSRVSEDVWRYWKTEGRQSSLESAMRDLERAVTQAKDNQTKVISALNKQITNLNSQKSTQRTLASQKDSEINSVLKKLKSYGFKVNTSKNTISNLGHAKSLKGEKAEKAETLLQTWHSLTSELITINDKIKDINGQITATKDEIKQQKIAKELKSFETQLKRVNAVLTSVTNTDSLYNTRFTQMGISDKEMNLKTNEEALASSKSNMSSLINEFNKLSLKTTSYKENGEQLKTTLESLGQQILAQADNIIKYRQAINDLEFDRINEDMNEFNNTLNNQGNKLTNNMNNLKDGLLSGTTFKDLASSKSELIDLSRDNVWEKQAKERINLEKEVQQALIAYEKKNIDRAKGVANSTLDINAKMYNELLKMKKDYTKGNSVSAKKLKADYGDLYDIARIDTDYAKTAKALEKYYEDVKKKQDALTKKYNADMAKAKNSQAKQSLTDKFIIDSLDIEKQYFEAQIKANNKAIAELKTQMSDASEDDKKKIQDQISIYEQSNIDTQNKIKDSIKARFDFEFSLMDEALAKSNEAKNSLQNTYEILSSLGSDNYSGKGTILDAILKVEKDRNAEISKNIANLQKQQKLYEAGSFEWKIINDELSNYNQQLTESNKQLIDMNKNILSNSFSSTTYDLERTLFGGKSHDAWQQHQQLWMEGLEKEIALEKMYKRMADLGTTVNSEKLDLLAKQEKLSKFEMDYLNKQLDIIELQEKVDNLSKQKTVQVLRQNESGQWDWTYEADATQLDKAKDDLAQAQLELEKLEEKAREDYLQQLNKILSDAQEGNFESVSEFRKAMEDLGKAFDTAVGDIPEIGDSYIDDLVKAYAKFIKESSGVVASNPADAYLVQATETMTSTLKKTFTDISKDLGEIFANALLAKLPSTSSVSANKAVKSSSTAVSIDKVEFPNATSKDEIQEAILGLPQLALQKSKSKV